MNLKGFCVGIVVRVGPSVSGSFVWEAIGHGLILSPLGTVLMDFLFRNIRGINSREKPLDVTSNSSQLSYFLLRFMPPTVLQPGLFSGVTSALLHRALVMINGLLGETSTKSVSRMKKLRVEEHTQDAWHDSMNVSQIVVSKTSKL
ncbi:hypothetical protein QJS04_geneDACA008276 [Acorus gramineus]|uniref:Uncharacterized protein n=1 Tax=Acorus gramineus TaxID=55184 RepID=A0AAV9AVK4_ACOGR|nr:hypothetical protein QJS04_geneDACA008276 [Acorus gramineus]